MNPRWRGWLQLWGTAGIPAAAVSLCAGYVLESWTAVVWVAGGCLAVTIAHAWLLRQQRLTALSQLRYPELRGVATQSAGIFGRVIDEVSGRLGHQEAAVKLAQQTRVEVEARGHIRQKQAQRLESVLQCISEPVFVFDVSSRPVFSNTAAGALIRESGGDGNDWTCLPELATLLDESRWKKLSQRLRTVDFSRPVGGKKHTFRATGLALRDDDASPLGMAVLIRDVSHDDDQKSRHAEFVSSVCHELKTPLASIKAFVEMLMDDETVDREEQQRLYGFVDVQLDRLTRLVNNMLNLARIESGVIQIHRENCSLNELLQKALDVVEPMAREKSLVLSAEFSELYIGVHIDRDLLSQAVINLLSNAVKYTPKGGSVWLRSRQEDGEAIIEVEDTGMGIPDEDQKRLFQRFFRVERNSHAASGTGLGLALVQYIVQNIHSGRVTVQSRTNEGSRFAIALPLGHREAARRPREAAHT